MLQKKNNTFLELKKKIFFVLLGLLIYRIGSYIPVPGINPEKLSHFFHIKGNSILGMFNMFSGGSLSRLTIFALGIMPYISASIIIQLMTSSIPKLEELKKEGEIGQRKITSYTRYFAAILSIFQSLAITQYVVMQKLVYYTSSTFYITSMVTLTTGTMFLMWLGEQISEYGIGNGISIIITAGILSGIPNAVIHVFEEVREGNLYLVIFFLVFISIFFVILLIIYFEKAQRCIPVHYAKRQHGRRIYTTQDSHLPLKINMSGVIPAIFASSMLLFLSTLFQWFSNIKYFFWLKNISLFLYPGTLLYTIIFAFLIVFFCFFYTALVFNPKDTADNLKKTGAFIPGIRPGEQTAKFIDLIMSKLTTIGSIYITFVCLFPIFIHTIWNIPFYFGGTSLLIVVVVIMDFISQIQSYLISNRHYSLLKNINFKKN